MDENPYTTVIKSCERLVLHTMHMAYTPKTIAELI